MQDKNFARLRESFKGRKRAKNRKLNDETVYRIVIGHTIAIARGKQWLSQAKLAKRLKVAQALIAQIENGYKNITIGTLRRIAKALKKDVAISFVDKPIAARTAVRTALQKEPKNRTIPLL